MAKIETAPYQTLESDGQFELRAYEAFYTASVGSSAWETSNGFNQIFDYISGNNATGEKISMTTPVINELDQSIASTEFVMPSDYAEKPLPKPQNPAVQIKTHNARLVATIRFSGIVGAKQVKEQEGKLRQWIQTKGLQPIGTPRLARYNPPFMPPFLRRNELHLDVQKA